MRQNSHGRALASDSLGLSIVLGRNLSQLCPRQALGERCINVARPRVILSDCAPFRGQLLLDLPI